MKQQKQTNEQKAFIRLVKHFLRCDQYATATIETPEGILKAVVLSESNAQELIIKITQNEKEISLLKYFHELNKWKTIRYY
jgi:prolyl-tRNA editing enzyme YbaK/EbsC (Cys-tRNA(Pro) deacylase)